MSLVLSPQDLVELTKRKYAGWQARELDHLRIPYKRRTDGSIVVLRADVGGTQDEQHRREPRLRSA